MMVAIFSVKTSHNTVTVVVIWLAIPNKRPGSSRLRKIQNRFPFLNYVVQSSINFYFDFLSLSLSLSLD
jgi:hypothetical protein